jgi:hypothetical protein
MEIREAIVICDIHFHMRGRNPTITRVVWVENTLSAISGGCPRCRVCRVCRALSPLSPSHCRSVLASTYLSTRLPRAPLFFLPHTQLFDASCVHHHNSTIIEPLFLLSRSSATSAIHHSRFSHRSCEESLIFQLPAARRITPAQPATHLLPATHNIFPLLTSLESMSGR